VPPLIFTQGVPFFLSTRRTMKKSKQYLLLALVIAIVAAFAYLITPTNPLRQKINSDIAKVNARFTPSQSIDLSMAMKMTAHDPPYMLNPPEEVPPLLLFPPSAEDLEKLSGE
jgi:hypothetical protein